VAPTAVNRGELDPVRLRTAALSWIIVPPNIARGSWRGFLFAWRWSGDDVDAGQLVYPLIAFSHIRCRGHSSPSTS